MGTFFEHKAHGGRVVSRKSSSSLRDSGRNVVLMSRMISRKEGIMRKLALVALMFMVGLVCLQCSKSADPVPAPNPPPELNPSDKSLIQSSNRFGLALFRNIIAAEEDSRNVFVSPLSISFALGMTLNGARGETYDAMQSTLELSGLTKDEINTSYKKVIELLTGLDPHVAFSIANSIWYREGFPISPAFVEVNRDYFNAATRGIDFDQIWAADTINHWVDVNTRGKITEIIQPPIDPSAIMFLINAIYFKGNWTLPFDTASTIELPFTRGDGSVVERPIMRTDTLIDYYANDLFQAVDFPYGHEKFSMVVILPRLDHTIDDIVDQLTDENWAAWMSSFEPIDLPLGMPKFKLAYEIKLNDVLKAMGMSIAFDPAEADLLGMVADSVDLFGNLFISFVKHKTFVQVDEIGTEAAAVTIVGIDVTGIREEVVVTRPFLFAVRERETGTILFMGKIDDPVWED